MANVKKEKVPTPLKAIRAKCIDCCCGDRQEIKYCTVEKCALYPYRMGKNPNRTGVGGKKGKEDDA